MARAPVPVPQAQPAEPATRVPMAVKLESRDGLLVEGLITNGFVEMKKGQLSTFLRPGLDTAFAAGLTAGQGVLVGPDELFVVGGATIKFKPNRLTFTVQPTDVVVDTSISPAVKVAIQSSTGSTLTYEASSVTIALENNPGSAVLSGTLTVAAVAGVATFSDLSLDVASEGYTLKASIPGLSKVSTSFDVSDLVAFTMVAALIDTPSPYGFEDPPFGFPDVGSVTPSTLNGAAYRRFYVEAAVGLDVSLAGNLGSAFFTSIALNGTTTHLASAAAYNQGTYGDGTPFSRWFWAGVLPISGVGTYTGSYKP